LPYIGTLADIPNGWHLCDGTDGTPNLLDNRFLEGDATPGIFKEPGLPNITGKMTLGNGSSAGGTHVGSYYYIGYFGSLAFAKYDGNWGYWYGFDAELGRKYWHQQTYGTAPTDTIFGNSTTVQPKSYTVYYIIKMK